jgi:hypothetical protein
MDWYPRVVLYMGVFDGGVIMLGGLVLAVVFLMKWNADALYERLIPALATLILSNIAAAIILGATRWLIGK